jgi:dipeptidyl-peptidase-4
MMEVVKKADEETIKLVSENKGDLKRGVQFTMAAEPEPIKLLIRETESYRDDAGRTRTRPTGRTYWIDSVKHSNHFEPRVMAGVPQGYYFPSQLSKVAEKLREHGITVVTVPKKVKLDAEIYTITKFTRAARPAYGDHRTVTTEGAFSLKQVTVDAGSYFVDIKQPLAWLIMYMLEPQSDDGLLYWNYFDDYLLPKEVETRSVDYPVFKLVEPVK